MHWALCLPRYYSVAILLLNCASLSIPNSRKPMAYYIPGQRLKLFCKYDGMSPTISIHYLDVQGMQTEWNAVTYLHCRLMGIGWLGLLFARQRIPSNVQFRFLFTRPKIPICHSWMRLLDPHSLTARSLDEHPQYFMTQFSGDLKYFKNAVTTAFVWAWCSKVNGSTIACDIQNCSKLLEIY